MSFKNWIRFACFCILFILLFSWMNVALGQPQESWVDFYKLPRNSVDVVFVGNSHSIYAFQPQIIDDILPDDSYVIGTNGENIFVSYYELREILKYQKPKVVVLETFTLNLTKPIKPALIFSFTDAGRWDINKAAVIAKYFPLNMAQTAIPVFRTTMDWNNPGQILSKFSDQLGLSKNDSENEFKISIFSLIMSKEDYQAAHNLPEITYQNSPDENRLYLDKFVALCKKNNIQLLLVTAPVIKISGDDFENYTSFDVTSYADENQIALLTFDKTRFNEMHYVDADHVNIFGSVILSADTALEISKKFDIPLDQDKLDYYRSFYFSNYIFTYKDNEFCLTLNPENLDAPLEYQYNFYRMKDGEKVVSSDWQKNNEYHFTLPDKEGYYMETHIRNTNGDYSITAVFLPYKYKGGI